MAKLKFDPSLPVIVLDVTLEGKIVKRRIKMAVDTGATYTMIPWEIAEALGYRPDISVQRVTLITASGIERAPLIKIDSLRVCNKEVKNGKVICHDLPQKSYVDGLLGLNTLKELKVKIDFGEATIEA
ncbi:retroviral-like aspartic protease family protein [Candidatus Aerophobetes bacterium]|nr:retroviral-like aspartic protease family protein [Candidatus Aerophobetes bacterium]